MNDEVMQGKYTWEEFCQKFLRPLAEVINNSKISSTQIEDNMENYLDMVWKEGFSSESVKSI